MIQYFLSRLNKEKKIREEDLKQYGVVLGDIQTDVIPNRFFICLIRGLLIFMASFGTIGGIISAFELPFNYFLVILALFTLSMYVAFLYYNRFTFYIGYIILFILFATTAFLLYWHINSGYQAFWNCVFEKYSDYFRLSYFRESTEYITDRYTTISVMMTFVGFLYCILLNITISGYMNLPETFLLTFLPLQIPLYIDRLPKYPYLIMLLAVYITVTILGRSNHFQLSYKQNRKQSFQLRRKNNTQEHSYLSSGISMLTISIYSIVFGTSFLLLTSGIFYSNFNGQYISNPIKNITDEYVKTYIQNGLFSFFNRYEATGGLSRGKLGGVSSINPDFEPDLLVTFVPYSSGSLYLRAYTGSNYENNLFAHEYDESYLDDYIPFASEENPLFGRMQVVNLDADADYQYHPYDTFYSTESSMGSPIYTFTEEEAKRDFTEAFQLLSDTETDLPEDSLDAFDVLYLPYEEQIAYPKNPSITEEYEDSVYNNYLQLPAEPVTLIPALDTFCQDAGLNELAIQERNASTYAERQAARLAIVSSLKRYFATNYDYTMAPGSTPRNRDTVEYFLTTQKRGYCAHFASSAALILRNLGIPTRYCEGYMITLSDVMDATVLSNQTSDWMIGTLPTQESGLIEVSVTDASAHAWIEVYIDGYGWIPVDMTPPSSDTQVNNNDLLGLFSGLFAVTPRGNLPEDNLEIELPDFENQSKISFDYLLKPFIIVMLSVITIFIGIGVFVQLKKQYHTRILLHHKDYSGALVQNYLNMLNAIHFNKRFHTSHPTLSEVVETLGSLLPNNQKELIDLEHILQKAAFSGQQISKADYFHYSAFLQSLAKSFRTLSKSKGFPHK